MDVYVKGHVKPKTEGQKAYVHAMFHHDLTFCIAERKDAPGEAVAATMLKPRAAGGSSCAARRSKPANALVSPGDLQAKVNPYLRPLFDALNDMMDFEQVKRLMTNDVIEVSLLASRGGRTASSFSTKPMSPARC